MTEMMWCEITVKLPESWGGDPTNPPWVVRELAEDADFEPTISYIGGAPVRAVLWEFSGEWNYGVGGDSLDHRLSVLRSQHIPYHAADDPKYEFVGSVESFDGFTLHGGNGSTQGATLNLRQLSDFRTLQMAMEHLRRLDEGILAFPILHLPPQPPPEP